MNTKPDEPSSNSTTVGTNSSVVSNSSSLSPCSSPLHSGKTIIAYSPGIEDYELFLSALTASRINVTEAVFHSEKAGSLFGRRYATENSIPFKQFPICWNAWGKQAPFMRTYDMVEYSDAAIVLWSGLPKKDTIRHLIRVCCHPAYHIVDNLFPQDTPIPCYVFNVKAGTGTYITPEILYLLDLSPHPRKKKA